MIIDPKKYPDIQRILSRAHGYMKKNAVEMKKFDGPMELSSSWSGGTRYDYSVINLENLSTLTIPECGEINQPGRIEFKTLPVNYCLIECVMFQGSPMTPRIYMNPENLGKYLEENKVELTPEEAAFFEEYRSLKSSYRPKNETLKKSLQNKGFIDSRGAVTVLGRNWGKGF